MLVYFKNTGKVREVVSRDCGLLELPDDFWVDEDSDDVVVYKKKDLINLIKKDNQC